MKSKTIETHEIPNYDPIIKEVIDFSAYAPVKSHRWNLHKKLVENYLDRSELIFIQKNGEWRHYLGQLNMARPRHQRRTPVIIKRLHLTLHTDNTISWHLTEFE